MSDFWVHVAIFFVVELAVVFYIVEKTQCAVKLYDLVKGFCAPAVSSDPQVEEMKQRKKRFADAIREEKLRLAYELGARM